MKALVFIAGMALVGGIGGAAYSEYDRVTSSHKLMRAYIVNVTNTYKNDEAAVIDAARQGVERCAADLYMVETPPVLNEFLARNIATDYEIVKRHGLQANQKKDEILDIRNALGTQFYSPLSDELAALGPQVKERINQMNADFRIDRDKLAHCTHAAAYKILFSGKAS